MSGIELSGPNPLSHIPGAISQLPVDSTGDVNHRDDSGAPAWLPIWHFSQPLAEQQHFTTSAGIVDHSDREFLTITGPQVRQWLNGFTTQKVDDLQCGQCTRSFILDANGRIEHGFVLMLISHTDVEEALVMTPAGGSAALHEFLEKMVFWSGSVIQAATESYACVSVTGPHCPQVVSQLTNLVFSADLPLGTLPSFDLVIPRDQLVDTVTALQQAGGALVGRWGWDAARVLAGGFVVGLDTDEKTVPHEVGAIGSTAERGWVHLEKGCYRGQETVARVHNLGQSPRKLVTLSLDGSTSELPAPGTQITADGRSVGVITTAVHHWEMGPIALGLVRRAVSSSTQMLCGSSAAMVLPDGDHSAMGTQAGKAAVRQLKSG